MSNDKSELGKAAVRLLVSVIDKTAKELAEQAVPDAVAFGVRQVKEGFSWLRSKLPQKPPTE